MTTTSPRDPAALDVADTLSDALAAERRGESETAAELYEKAVRLGGREGALPELLEALRGRARMFQQDEQFDLSDEVAELCLEIAQRTGELQAAGRAVNVLGINAYLQHQYEVARERYEEALQLAYEAGDGPLVGWVCQNTGVLANITGDLTEARRCYLECVAASLMAEDDTGLTAAYNNLGMVCTDLKEYAQAVLFFDRGIDLAKRLGSDAMLARLKSNRAEPLICMDRTDAAARSLDAAEAIARDVDDPGTLAMVYRFRAVIARLADDLELAGEHLRKAVALAEEHDLELERAEALGGYARIHRARGDEDRALATLDEALAAFRKLGAARETRRLEEVRAEWTGEEASGEREGSTIQR